MPQFKLGKTKAKPMPRGTLKLSAYLNQSQLPPLTEIFGHSQLVTQPWGMLANDSLGCCVWSGAGHETIEWNACAGRQVTITDDNTISDYAAVTGYTPNDPSTDNGTDMVLAAQYRKNTGIIDAAGCRHKIADFLALKPGDWNEYLYAIYLFGGVGIGIEFPNSAMDQVNAGQPWTVQSGSSVEGGHYIPGFNRLQDVNGVNDDWITIVTWGQTVQMEKAFFETYCDEGIAYVSNEYLLNGGVTLEGFNQNQLLADLRALLQV